MPIYDIATIGTSNNLITFNDDTNDPYYRVSRRSLTRREIDEFDIRLPEQMGDADFQSWVGKSYQVLEGKLYPGDDPGDLDNGKKALRKLASLEYSQADADSDQGYVPYKYPELDGYNKQIFVKVMYVDLSETTSGTLPFRLLCKVKYPVIFGQTLVAANIGSSTASISGGIGYPFSYPVAYGSSTYQSSGSINNAGDLATWPQSIVINGPINVPRVTNSTTGEYVELNVNLATISDSVILTYDQDTLSITQAGYSILDKLTTTSTLFKLRSGINNLTLTGTSMGTGAYATVTALPTWPLG